MLLKYSCNNHLLVNLKKARLRDLTFIIGGGDRVEIFKKSNVFRRPPTLESKFFTDPPP